MPHANTAIYTAIFGSYDNLLEPTFKPVGCDFVCFSDKKIPSENWQIRVVESEFQDAARDNRKYKILPHRYLGGYDVSVYVDGNILVRGDINKLTSRYLAESHMALYSHSHTRHRDREETPDFKDCLYQEAEALIEMYERGRFKEKPEIIRKQVDRYRREGYPEHRGFGTTPVLIRRHNEKDVISAMEVWWDEYKKESRRDQLSFNYITWKENFNPIYISDNMRNNEYFLNMPHNKKKK